MSRSGPAWGILRHEGWRTESEVGHHWQAEAACCFKAARKSPTVTMSFTGVPADYERPYRLTLDRGLQLRIAPDGVRTLRVRYIVKGSSSERQYRLPREYGEGPGQIKLADARAEAARIRALAHDGVDWPAQEEARLRAEATAREAAERQAGVTLAQALREYVEKKRRTKGGLPLKARTKSDYPRCGATSCRTSRSISG